MELSSFFLNWSACQFHHFFRGAVLLNGGCHLGINSPVPLQHLWHWPPIWGGFDSALHARMQVFILLCLHFFSAHTMLNRIAVVRPFAVVDTNRLIASFDSWGTNLPCNQGFHSPHEVLFFVASQEISHLFPKSFANQGV